MAVMLPANQVIGDLGRKSEVTHLNLALHLTALLVVLGVLLAMVVLLVAGVPLELNSNSISLQAWARVVLVKPSHRLVKLVLLTATLFFLLCVHRVLNYLASTIPILVLVSRLRSLLVLLPLLGIVICSVSDSWACATALTLSASPTHPSTMLLAQFQLSSLATSVAKLTLSLTSMTAMRTA